MPSVAPPLRDGDRLTRDEFLRRWDAMPDLKRAELIDGVVSMPSPVGTAHGDRHSLLDYWMGHYVSFTDGCAVGAGSTWLMSPESAPQPDLSLRIEFGFGGQSFREGNLSAGAPELIAEITETTAGHDLGAKLRLYERSGVREYITIRPRLRQIIWRELHRRKFRELTPGAGGWYRSRVFPGLWLDPSALWTANRKALAAAIQLGTAQPAHAAFVRQLASHRK
jgi:hypothetical protein